MLIFNINIKDKRTHKVCLDMGFLLGLISLSYTFGLVSKLFCGWVLQFEMMGKHHLNSWTTLNEQRDW